AGPAGPAGPGAPGFPGGPCGPVAPTGPSGPSFVQPAARIASAKINSERGRSFLINCVLAVIILFGEKQTGWFYPYQIKIKENILILYRFHENNLRAVGFCKPAPNLFICFLPILLFMRLFPLVLLDSMAFLSGTSAHAQFPKGTRMVGASVANLSFNSGTSEQDVESIGNTTAKVTGFDISLSPSLGWFISENTVVGFTFSVEPSKERISFEENGSTFQRDETNR